MTYVENFLVYAAAFHHGTAGLPNQRVPKDADARIAK